MQPRVIDHLIEKIAHCVDTHYLGTPGQYARWLWQEKPEQCIWGERKLGLNEYGSADAANILYTIGRFPADAETRDGFVRTLQSMQNPETGMYTESTHHTVHTTAHCIAALELFDAKPLYPCTALAKYADKEALYELLTTTGSAHVTAGLPAIFINTGTATLEWKNWYFDWFWENTDPEIGFWDYGHARALPKEQYHHYMGGGFHIMFIHESEHRPYRYPEKMIDFCFFLLDDPENSKVFCEYCKYLDIDLVYSMTRASRQTTYRFDEMKARLEAFAERYLDMLEKIDYETDEYFNDLHMLFGAVCCLAELQAALPGKILTTRPLRLALDRRPFI